jgi:hypothetical protein
MMTALNRLADILSTRLDVRTLQVELEEDSSLFQSINFTPKPAATEEKGRNPIVENFHELVMSFANNPHSSELTNHLVGTTQEQFAELQGIFLPLFSASFLLFLLLFLPSLTWTAILEESMNVILPTLADWLQCKFQTSYLSPSLTYFLLSDSFRRSTTEDSDGVLVGSSFEISRLVPQSEEQKACLQVQRR